MAWTEEFTNDAQTEFRLTCSVCDGVITGGADTPENALSMIQNNEQNHVDP